MNFINIVEEELNQTVTLNGDKAYSSTGSFCLDLFSLIGAMRQRPREVIRLFFRAYKEDKNLSIKILFYSRDIRNGLGERQSFRYILYVLANKYQDVARELIPYIKEYGRFDDYLVFINSPLKDEVIKLFKETLESDIELKSQGKPYSLLAKWLPSINTSNQETRNMGNIVAKSLGMNQKEYRKMLSSLRKGMIIENNLRERDYTFNYEHVPSCANMKYKRAFYINDNERYLEFLNKVHKGTSKINTKDLYPYEIIRSIRHNGNENLEYLNAAWNSFRDKTIDKNILVVRDGSGSMYSGTGSVAPIDVATSLTMLFSSKLKGVFKDTFITFSERPKLVKIDSSKSIYEQYQVLEEYDDCSNTDINKVYKLILNVYKNPEFTPEDAIDEIVIISDMEFDCIASKKSTFEVFKEDFKKLGYEMPRIVFWNVDAKSTHTPVMKNEKGVVLVSGAAKSTIDTITNIDAFNPIEFMKEALIPYSFVDDLFKENIES